jgi:hypothetical protein
MNKSGTLGLAGHLAGMEAVRNVYIILARKLERRRPLEKIKCR